VYRFDSTPFGESRATISGGPTALAIDAGRRELVVFALFNRTLSLIHIPDDAEDSLSAARPAIELSHIDGRGLSNELLIGRRMFHDATDVRISSDGRACASCHPEGRDDGLVWPSPNGPRQTIFLAGRLERRAPFGWEAKHKDLTQHVRSTTKNLHGLGLDDTSIRYLTAWLAAMPGPARTTLPLSDEELHGRELFHSKLTGCGACHAEGDSDGNAHNVGSLAAGDKSSLFLAPSLRHVSGTAPYFHDGRYPSLFSLVQGCDGKMGSTKNLSVADMRALEAYLRTL